MPEFFEKQNRPAPAPKTWGDRFLPFALYWGVVLVGAAGVGFGVWSYFHERAFLARAGHAEARVTDIELGKDQHKFTTYAPFYVFTDSQGNIWTNTGPSDTREYYKVGSSVPVIYDPDHPDQSQIDSFWSKWDAAVIPPLIGLLCLLLCIIPVMQNRSQTRAVAADGRR